MSPDPRPAAGITADGTDPLCVTFLLRLRKEIGCVKPGSVYVIATGPRSTVAAITP
ncbi:hypothetical protein [Streptomyces sp. NBC_01262]|uniref:hypothetical protein n=1 Tax=Streptomyces sp. NBC_01262 TaxID=2903803 RepID=UPI002E2FB7A1|nr:hypothetical protein [Streptomyces sp. NBC_01262]